MKKTLKSILKAVYRLLGLFGIDPRRALYNFFGFPSYIRDYYELKRQEATARTKFDWGKAFPCLQERFTESGVAKGDYFHQDLLVARRIFENNPALHVDVGSRIDGFVAHVASYRKIEVIDIRKLDVNVQNISFLQADMMQPIQYNLVEYCDSLSCLHALEHFGLGRYGDPVTYDGYLMGLENLWKILKPGGKLYFSVPIGPQRIEFNAHRVFSVDYLIQCFSGKFNIENFSYVDDKGDLHENVDLSESDVKNSFGCKYGCGIFEMIKNKPPLV